MTQQNKTWEERFDSLRLVNDWGVLAPNAIKKIKGLIKQELSTAREVNGDALKKAFIDGQVNGYRKGCKEERETWINQTENDHDNKIRKFERERIRNRVQEMKLRPDKDNPNPLDREEESFNHALFKVLSLLAEPK